MRRLAPLVAAGAALLAAAAPRAAAQATPADTGARRPATGSAAVPARPDSIRVDSSRALRDSTRARSAVPMPRNVPAVNTDTLRAPFAHAETPVLTEYDSTFVFTRAQIYGSGALTLLDLVERVPGLTGFRAGWLLSPMTVAYMGDPGRLRVFYDGLELEPLDARLGRSLDLSSIPLASVEDVRIERGASEVRVYMRSWRVRSRAPYTRADIATGDENTNAYRGYYGKRFTGGAGLQLAAQQASTNRGRFGGDGTGLDLMARYGYAAGPVSFDGFVERSRHTRSLIDRVGFGAGLPALDATRTTAYIRAAYGDPDRGAWAQALAGSLGFRESSARIAPVDTADTISSRAQYVAAAGFTRGALRLSGTSRIRVFDGIAHGSYVGSAGFASGPLAAEVRLERDARAREQKAEALVRLMPLPFVSLSGAYARGSETSADSGATETTGAPDYQSVRGEAAIRLRDVWIGGGVMARDTARLLSFPVFDSSYASPGAIRGVGRRTGSFATVRGRLYHDVYARAFGVAWTGDESYLPKYQSRSELYLDTNFGGRFRASGFSLLVSGMHEYRSGVLFPRADGSADFEQASRQVTTLVEIRVLQAQLFWRFTNAFQDPIQQVPGYYLPRGVSVYGVRWEFIN